MDKLIFEFLDYKPYLRSFINSQPGQGRGIRARMAEVMGCQQGFLTKVLSDPSANLSLEQADKLSTFLQHSKEESDFLLLMVSHARAGTSSLRGHFHDQMKRAINRRLEARKSLQSRAVLSSEDHMTYYSAWFYTAIRVAVSIGTLQTKEALATRLKLPLPTVISALNFLTSRGLIEQRGDRFYRAENSQMQLAPDHPMVARHHVNWRAQVLKSLDIESPHDLHYSYVVTLSENDALQIRSFLVEMIQEVLKRAAPSKEETIYSFCLDYFEI